MRWSVVESSQNDCRAALRVLPRLATVIIALGGQFLPPGTMLSSHSSTRTVSGVMPSFRVTPFSQTRVHEV